MTDPVFVDSNVLVYAFDDADPTKQRAAQHWRTALWKARLGRLSFQVLSEFYVNVLRIRKSAAAEVRDEIRDLMAWRPVLIDATLVETGWAIQDRYKLSYWDALIVAAAKASSSPHLLTEDLQPDQDFDGVRVVSPFLTKPTDLT
jgi:predicted nucleic acid-binding protein